MNANDRRDECEHFELLISCSIDGELTGDEQQELTVHLDGCSSCRQRCASFQTVTDLARQLGVVDGVPALKVVDPSSLGKQRIGHPVAGPWLRYAPYAALVSLVAGLLVWIGAVLPNPNRTDASEIVAPLVSLVQINSTRQEDQEFFKDSLELDMRALRLQIDALDDPQQRDELKEQFEQLLQRIKEI